MADRVLAGLRDDQSLAVWNRTASKCTPLVERGARQVGVIAELATCDVVFVCVTRSEDLLEVLLGDHGLLAAEAVPQVVVDCSTVSAEASAEARAALAARGTAFLAAPVSGNPDMVREGSAALAVSGPRDSHDAVLDTLLLIAPTVAHVGPGEEARLVKICHNLLLAVITQGLSEVTTLAEKAGISSHEFLAFINGSVLGSPFIKHKGRALDEGDFTPTFTSYNLRKDYDIGMGAARSLEVPMPLTTSTFQLIQTVIGRGLGDLDYLALYLVQAASAGMERRPR